MTVPTAHTIPHRHLIGDHLLVPCSECGGELQRVLISSGNPRHNFTREKHIVCAACAHDYGPDTTEMLVEGGRDD